MKGKEFIGQMVAIPINGDNWMLGMIVDCTRARVNNKLYYDIEWYSPEAGAVQLIGYGQEDINMFRERYEDVCKGRTSPWGAYEMFFNEIQDAVHMKKV